MDKKELKAGALGLLVTFVAFFLSMGLIEVAVYPLQKKACYETSKELGLESTYGFWTDCIVTTDDGRKIPLNKYYYTINNEGN